MSESEVEARIAARLEVAGVPVDARSVELLSRYVALLARWNRRINLTAFDLDDPTDQAIDRLIVEAVAAAPAIHDSDRVVVDIGSGGGSPALPLKIMRPHVRLTLVEARVRKSAFLREAIRDLALDDAHVETFHLNRTGHPRLNGTADVVTMRAVRADAVVFEGVAKLLRPKGRLLWFAEDANARGDGGMPAGWSEKPPSDSPAFLRVLTMETSQ